MPEFVIGLRSKEDAIHFIRVKGQSITRYGQGQDIYWRIAGETAGAEIVINPEVFVFAGPKEMITDLG